MSKIPDSGRGLTGWFPDLRITCTRVVYNSIVSTLFE